MDDPHTAGPLHGLSLVIPAYNEGPVIAQAIAEADAALARIAEEYEVLVVDDGSTDDTFSRAQAAARDRPRVRLLQHPSNRGYGAALRTGFEAARLDRIAFTDADCQFHLDDLASLLALCKTHPVAAGYRIDRKDSRLRCIVSRGYNLLVRALVGTRVRDCDCALKVFRKEALEPLLPESSGFFVNTEMLARARQLGLGVAEAGVRHRPRARGESKVSPGDVPRVLRILLPFWWTRVLFAGEDSASARSAPRPPDEAAPGTGRWGLLLVLLVAVVLFFTRLGCPLQEPIESRHAEAPRQMLAAGQWLVPSLHGQAAADVSPLSSWLIMASYTILGVHDWSARLVASTAAVLVVVLTYFWGRRVLGPGAALAGALVLCLSARFVYLGRLLTPDILLAACTVAALAAAHLAVRGPQLRRGWWLLSALACGLGVLAAGPTALLLAAGPIGLLQALDSRVARPSRRSWLLYLGAVLGVAASWYAAAVLTFPRLASEFFRFLRPDGAMPLSAAEPLWLSVAGLVAGMLPWALLLPGLVRFLGRHSAGAAARRPAALGLFLLAFLMALGLFLAGRGERPTSVLPALPPLALLLGSYLDAVLVRHGAVLARRGLLTVLAAGAGLCLLAVGAEVLTATEGCLLAAALLGGSFLAARMGVRLPPAVAWRLCGAVTFALLLLGIHGLLPRHTQKLSLRRQIHAVADPVRSGTLPIVCYPRRWDSISFYLQRGDIRAYTPGQRRQMIDALSDRRETLVFVASGRPLEELRAALPAGMEFVPRGQQGVVAVGSVRWCPELPPGLYAQAEPRAAVEQQR
jgi:dolichol-phosphate mannosyltransferase